MRRDGAVIGWDIGGAHLKAAWVDADGRVGAIRQVPCRLWEGLDRFDAACATVLTDLPPAERHRVTMTGELVDLFPDRAAGVAALVAAAGRLPGQVRFWAGDAGFVAAADTAALAVDIASANWLATAMLVARDLSDALLVDVGSTTTDLIPIAGGRVVARGRTDRERLAAGELLYTGLTRTPVMAVAGSLPWDGLWVPVMAEHFATTADVYRVLGSLEEAADQHPPADGGEKTVAASARRLGRMIGVDAGEADAAAWRRLAAALAEGQMQAMTRAAHLTMSGVHLPDAAPVVGAGAGRALARTLAARLDRPYGDIGDRMAVGPDLAAAACQCAPAVAVALLGR